ncbi:hypothetical protein [Tropicimonas aquimaris]|uniref:Uncharacterized protein n=1 Tax=Tropicimonas aquimaris TaxID=914152 RepID=A0ABW3ITA3_9RHOB
MDRLALLVTLAAGTSIPGALVILVLVSGIYSWTAILGAVIVGLLLAYPVSYWAARRIKREDPEWNSRRERPITAAPGEKPQKI